MIFKYLLTYLILSIDTTTFASGSVGGGGGGGKSSGQVSSEESSFKGGLGNFRKKLINSKKGIVNTFDHKYQELSKIFKRNVYMLNLGKISQVDYKNINKTNLKKEIDIYLSLNKSFIDTWKRKEQLAFYFNLYNVLTVDLILKNYPIKSIKDLGSGFPLYQSPWKRRFFELFGKMSYLDRIEHEIVRGSPFLRDPLVHFAFNCASIGCPALLNKPFIGSNLENQLQAATKNFLRDRTRNYLKGKTLYVSAIFKWYRSDFEKGLRDFSSLYDFFNFYRKNLADNIEGIKILKSKKYKIKFLDYNWKINNKISKSKKL